MKKKQLHLMSWNVNGIRAAIKKGFESFLDEYDPDILCLQETKAMREQVDIDFPKYQEFWHSAERKGYSGTAIFTKEQPLNVAFGIDPALKAKGNLVDEQGRDAATEGRVMTIEFDDYYVVTAYVPNTKGDLSRLGFRHKDWDPLFLKHVKKLEKKKPVIFCGDMNVAHNEIDLARPKANDGKNGFTKEEREGFDNIVGAGFVDTFRYLHPDTTDAYSWWSFRAKARERNVGWRIDYVCVSDSLKDNITDAAIHPEVFGSDHCPVSLKINL